MRTVKVLWGVVVLLSAALLIVCLYSFGPQRGGKPGLAQPSPTPGASGQVKPDDDPVVAKIGSRTIKRSELSASLFERHGAELLSQMLDRAAIQMEADTLAIKATQPEIAAELKRMQQGYDSEEQFYQSMKDQVGLTKSELAEDVYFKLLLERIATRNVTVTEGEVDEYIQKHPEEFRSHVQLHLLQIVGATLEQANRTLDLLRSGQDFAKLARDRSIDTATAGDGGDLGWVEENDPFLPPPVMKAASKLKTGEVSAPVQTENGFVVIKLVDRKETSKGDAAQLRDALRSQLALQKAPPLRDLTAGLRSKYGATISDDQLK
ncbi:peptidylprolyl isomerase [Paenibacillus cymbidii]|uniref:peptidylprolyl isomerase n=1 Tax=Paenibacillus cymbidii TaxID=1639034 RepID=UPI0010804BE8|nr:peptidylprolyl isomerase [Paenibacillus cymbidii]